MEHVEVLRDLRDLARAAIDAGDWVVDGACDPDAVLRRADAAIASLSAPQPPAETQPVAPMTGDLLPCPFCGAPAERIDFGPGDAENEGGSCIACTRCQSSGPVEFGRKENFVANWNRRTAPPSAPVGVDLDKVAAHLAEHGGDFDALILLVQEAALAQQPAAVDGVRGLVAKWREEATAYVVRANERDKSGGFRWAGWMRDELRSKAGVCKRHADELESALAAQPGGSDNDR